MTTDYISNLTEGRVTIELLEANFKASRNSAGNVIEYTPKYTWAVKKFMTVDDMIILIKNEVFTLIKNADKTKNALQLAFDFTDGGFKVTCTKCGGNGLYDYYSVLGGKCLKCHGRGWTRSHTAPKNAWVKPA